MPFRSEKPNPEASSRPHAGQHSLLNALCAVALHWHLLLGQCETLRLRCQALKPWPDLCRAACAAQLHSDAVQGPAGPTGWSAPLFFTVHSIGMGMTFGAALLESMILLNSKDAVTAFTREEVGVLSDYADQDEGPLQHTGHHAAWFHERPQPYRHKAHPDET